MRLSLPAEFTIAALAYVIPSILVLAWGMGTEIPTGLGMEPINIKTPPPLPIPILFTKTGNSIRPIQPQNASLSLPSVALPRVYINNIGADRIVRCVRVMMSTHRSECFDCKSTLDWPNGADGITKVVRKCSKKRDTFNRSLALWYSPLILSNPT